MGARRARSPTRGRGVATHRRPRQRAAGTGGMQSSSEVPRPVPTAAMARQLRAQAQYSRVASALLLLLLVLLQPAAAGGILDFLGLGPPPLPPPPPVVCGVEVPAAELARHTAAFEVCSCHFLPAFSRYPHRSFAGPLTPCACVHRRCRAAPKECGFLLVAPGLVHQSWVDDVRSSILGKSSTP